MNEVDLGRQVILGAAMVLATLTASPARSAPQCAGHDLRQILTEQGFTGALNDGGDTLRLIGPWGGPRGGYIAYWYEHIDHSRQAGHAVRSVIVLDRSCRYLGRYTVNPSKANIRGRVIYFADTSPADGNRIVLTPNGPPTTARIDGEVPELAK
jgi:hypothetical protein